MATGDYPTWVYDPTGVNPPVFVLNDPAYVALLNTPLPSTAIPGTPPTSTPTTPGSTSVVAQPAGALTQVGGTTVAPPNAKFIRMPQVGVPVPVVSVNRSPHVVGKR